MEQADTEQAEKVMTGILEGLEIMDISKWKPKFLVGGLLLPSGHPRILKKGKHAIVFDLKNSEDLEHDLCGKTAYYIETNVEGVPVPNGFLYLAASPCGLIENGLERTIESLEKMGVSVPFHKEFKVKVPHGRTSYFTIAKDLREGKYEVSDACDFQFEKMSNGNELKSDFEESVRKILAECEAKRYKVYLAWHGVHDEPSEAIQHIFFVQYCPRTHKGNLAIGDLDHLVIYKK